VIFSLKLTHGKLHAFACFEQKHECLTEKNKTLLPKVILEYVHLHLNPSIYLKGKANNQLLYRENRLFLWKCNKETTSINNKYTD